MNKPPDKALITPDPTHHGWWTATGRDLLTHTHRIGSVETVRTGGITYHDEFAADVRAALTTAGYQIIDTKPRGATKTPPRATQTWNHLLYVSDEDDLTVLPADTPGGHWQDESDTCPRCNPDRPRRPQQTASRIPGAETS
jgi:hypothetical protein